MRNYLTRQAMKALKASVVMLTFFGVAGIAMADKKITFKTPSAFGTNLPITGSTYQDIELQLVSDTGEIIQLSPSTKPTIATLIFRKAL